MFKDVYAKLSVLKKDKNIVDSKTSMLILSKKVYAWKALFSLFNDSFWRSFYGPFFTFAFPLIFIVILGSVLGYDSLLGGALSISISAVSLSAMPQAIFEYKNSSLLKRIGSTTIKPFSFLAVIGLFYFIMMLLSVVWLFLFSLAFFGGQYWELGRVIREANVSSPEIRSLPFSQVLQNINWGGFIYGVLANVFIGALCGLVLVSISKSTLMIQAIGITIMITSQFLSAQVFPIGSVRDIDALWNLSYFLSPFKSPVSMMIQSWNGSLADANNVLIPTADGFLIPNIEPSNIFDFSEPYFYNEFNGGRGVEIFSIAEKKILIALPFIWATLLIPLILWKFRWSLRG